MIDPEWIETVVHAHPGEHHLDGTPVEDEVLISPPGVWPAQYRKVGVEEHPAGYRPDEDFSTPFG